MKNYYISTLAFLATLISLGLPSNIISMEEHEPEKLTTEQKQEEISPDYFEKLDDVTIIDKIFPKLHDTDLLNLSRTSKRMKSLVNEYIPKYKEKLNKRLDLLNERTPELIKIIAFRHVPNSEKVKAGNEIEIITEQLHNMYTELTALGTQYSTWTTQRLRDRLEEIDTRLRYASHPKPDETPEQTHERESREENPLFVEKQFILAELKKRGVK